MKWFGYRHVNGSIHVKRYFGERDLTEAKKSDFVNSVIPPFDATSHTKALAHARCVLDYDRQYVLPCGRACLRDKYERHWSRLVMLIEAVLGGDVHIKTFDPGICILYEHESSPFEPHAILTDDGNFVRVSFTHIPIEIITMLLERIGDITNIPDVTRNVSEALSIIRGTWEE